MTADKNWYAVNIRENWAKKIVAQLSKKGIETLIPVTKVKAKNREGKLYMAEVPVFPKLLFVCIGGNEHNLVTHVDGVYNFLFWKNEYAIISPTDILSLCEFCRKNESLWTEKRNVAFTDDEAAEITETDLNSSFGVNGEPVSKVHLTTLGYNLVTSLAGDKIDQLQYAI